MKKPFVFLIAAALSVSAHAAENSSEKIFYALGDSTTAGTPGFQSPLEAPPKGSGNRESQYGHWISYYNARWTVWNRGVNGQRTDQILARFLKDPDVEKTDLVIVLAGVNDLYQGRPAETVKKNLAAIYDAAEARKRRVLACTILNYDYATADVRRKITEVNRWIREEAARRGLLFCDTAPVVEDPARPGYLYASPDGLHPGVAGYRRMAEAMIAVLAPKKS